jgi:hypothetical protein
MDYKLNNDRIVIEVEPVKLQTISEPYVVSTPFGYQVAIDVFETKKKRKKSLLLAAKSLFTELESLREENNGKLNGLEFWINKESAEKKSKYVIR